MLAFNELQLLEKARFDLQNFSFLLICAFFCLLSFASISVNYFCTIFGFTSCRCACISDGSQALDCIKAMTASAAACHLRGPNSLIQRAFISAREGEKCFRSSFKFKCNSLPPLFLLFCHLLRMFIFVVVIFLTKYLFCSLKILGPI